LDAHRGIADALLDNLPRRAAHRGERVEHLHALALDVHVVHQPEVDHVHPPLRGLDLAQCLEHVFSGHAHAGSLASHSSANAPSWSWIPAPGASSTLVCATATRPARATFTASASARPSSFSRAITASTIPICRASSTEIRSHVAQSRS